MCIREASLGEIADVLRHRRAMLEEMAARTDPAVLDAGMEASAAVIRRGMEEGSFRSWLADVGEERAVACASVHVYPYPANPNDPRPRRAAILNVHTDERFRRRGIARALVETAVDWCREAGFGSVALHASDAGRRLYAGMGFVPTSEMRLKLRGSPSAGDDADGDCAGVRGWSDLRPAVRRYAIAMESEFRNNEEKGDWRSANPSDLCDRIEEHVRALRRALADGADRLADNAATDVGNYAMMIHDILGARRRKPGEG
jgi:GNAT superfamily N-acetyltransferase